MATQKETNTARHRKNLHMLTGRHAGEYMEDGQPRGGGGETVAEEFDFHEAVLLTMDEVFDTYGLNESGKRTPYIELHPAVVIRPFVRRAILSAGGRPIKTTET